MKKFAVTLSNGKRVFISAVNLHDAVSKARIQYGQLPNDVNSKIVQDIRDSVNADIQELQRGLETISNAAKTLDWTTVYQAAGTLCSTASSLSEYVDDARGSLVKV